MLMAAKDILNEALIFEKKGEKMYSEIAKSTKDVFVRKIFITLSSDELVHAKTVEKFSKSFKVGSAFDENDLAKAENQSKTRIFGISISRFKKHARLSSKELRPFDIGIELEKKSIEYYQKGLNGSKSEIEKRLYEVLISAEKMHLDSLTKAKDFLSDPEKGFMELEEWLLDGGI